MNPKSISFLALAISLIWGCGTLRQSPDEKKAEQERIAQAVSRQLEAKDYQIDVNYMSPLRGSGQIVSGSYSIAVKGKEIDSHLPYVGVAHTVPFGGGKVLTFKDDIDEYSDSGWKKGQRTIVLSTNNDEDTIVYTLKVTEDGRVNIHVRCRERDAISYLGELRTDEPHTPLLNGNDLSGWKVVLKEEAQTPTFAADNGVLHISGQPFGYIRTEKSYSDYDLHLEWRWAGGAGVDGGIFHFLQGEDKVWPQGVQLQMTPKDMGMLMGGIPMEGLEGPFYRKPRQVEESPEKPVGEWNTMDFICRDGSIKAFLNGVLVNEASCEAKEGPIGIQSEGGAMDVRNIWIAELNQ